MYSTEKIDPTASVSFSPDANRSKPPLPPTCPSPSASAVSQSWSRAIVPDVVDEDADNVDEEEQKRPQQQKSQFTFDNASYHTNGRIHSADVPKDYKLRVDSIVAPFSEVSASVSPLSRHCALC